MPHAGGTKIRPLQGGIQIEGKPATGTLGLVVELEGKKYVLTAGHVVGETDTLVGQPTHDVVVGKVEENFLTENIDIAQVKVSMGVDAAVGRVLTSDTSHITDVFEHQTRPKKGDTVYIQGKESGALKATVEMEDADITTTTGEKISHACVVRFTDGVPTTGDSGAPVLSKLADGALCWGPHGGKVKLQTETLDWFSPFECVKWS